VAVRSEAIAASGRLRLQPQGRRLRVRVGDRVVRRPRSRRRPQQMTCPPVLGRARGGTATDTHRSRSRCGIKTSCARERGSPGKRRGSDLHVGLPRYSSTHFALTAERSPL